MLGTDRLTDIQTDRIFSVMLETDRLTGQTDRLCSVRPDMDR